MPPVIDSDICLKCNNCDDVCPSDVFFGSKKGEVPVITYPDECWHCNACVVSCPKEQAIKLRIPLPMMLLYQEKPPSAKL
jgi:adenylylsulfate reductase subunit B